MFVIFLDLNFYKVIYFYEVVFNCKETGLRKNEN